MRPLRAVARTFAESDPRMLEAARKIERLSRAAAQLIEARQLDEATKTLLRIASLEKRAIGALTHGLASSLAAAAACAYHSGDEERGSKLAQVAVLPYDELTKAHSVEELIAPPKPRRQRRKSPRNAPRQRTERRR